ncbi:Amidohydrolase family [Acididesulfobacillus acetoxydans]|uniref:Amidohydrolase family n=1 Tax=Acididesulfobacillus acetoxydans TaxID=1561005 RepID=A0A8S0WXF3_9FIRM|nr:D-aminoacylase [Acididesulfobacillus acetoxydans]CAA7600931.1 Amidohydrolase family [Acididesulfobacillus acetoxydans]CEJ08912.1 D-aminoacylase [Acididesulfobacillus acetoxydans]
MLIKDGTIIDGTGASRIWADVVVEDACIAGIGHFNGEGWDRVINAAGHIVCPGFIDTHSHSDLAVLVDPLVEPKVKQGVTTEVLGQDGISLAPLPREYIKPWRKNLAPLGEDSDRIDWHYETTESYLQLIENRRPGPNESYLVPHGNVRMKAMGLNNRLPTRDEMQRMREIVREEMETGVYGLSVGLLYVPGAYARTEELIELCKVVALYDGIFAIHQRSEADAILESMREVIRVGKESGVKVHFSHFKVCGQKNQDKVDRMLELIDDAESEGIRISFDQYPYATGSTMLGVILPPWAHDGGTDKLMARLRDPGLREKMVYDIEHGLPGWDNFIDFAGMDQIFISSVKTGKNQDLIGESLLEVGKMRGKDPYHAAFDLLLQEENAVGMVDVHGLEKNVVRLMKRPEQNVCTDGLLGGKPHPRVYGAFPRVLGKYVREQKVLTWEEGIRKMTGKAAATMGLDHRGTIAVGNYADIVVFDPETVTDNGDYAEPAQFPTGINCVIVNGQVAVENGRHTGIRAGRVLRRR